jgi:hypothetical protein
MISFESYMAEHKRAESKRKTCEAVKNKYTVDTCMCDTVERMQQ